MIGSVSLPPRSRRRAIAVKRGRKLLRVVAWLWLEAIAVSCLYPLVFVVLTSLKTQTQFSVNPLGIPSNPTLAEFRTVLAMGSSGMS